MWFWRTWFFIMIIYLSFLKFFKKNSSFLIFFIICILPLYFCNVKEGKGNNSLLPFFLTRWVFILFYIFCFYYFMFFSFFCIFHLLILIINLLITWHVRVMCKTRTPLAQKHITHCNIILFIFHIFYMMERGGKKVNGFSLWMFVIVLIMFIWYP